MRKRIFRTLVVLGATLLFVTLMGCPTATSNDTPPAALSSTVYAFTQTPGTEWPNLKIGVNPLTGLSISHLTYTFAVNSNMLLSAAGYGYNLEYNSLWSPNQTAPASPDAWTTTTDVAALTWGSGNTAYAATAGQGGNINNWYTGTAACTFYLKQINVTYTDATTEVFTFTTTTATPVHIVATSGTTDVAFAARLWVSNWAGSTDLTSALTSVVETVSF